jgi:hypothetical protein
MDEADKKFIADQLIQQRTELKKDLVVQRQEFEITVAKELSAQEKKFEVFVKKQMEQQRKEFEHYTGVLAEDFDHKLQAVAESVQVLPEMQETLNATFEKVGEISVDVEVIKETIQDHERRLQHLETR